MQAARGSRSQVTGKVCARIDRAASRPHRRTCLVCMHRRRLPSGTDSFPPIFSGSAGLAHHHPPPQGQPRRRRRRWCWCLRATCWKRGMCHPCPAHESLWCGIRVAAGLVGGTATRAYTRGRAETSAKICSVGVCARSRQRRVYNSMHKGWRSRPWERGRAARKMRKAQCVCGVNLPHCQTGAKCARSEGMIYHSPQTTTLGSRQMRYCDHGDGFPYQISRSQGNPSPVTVGSISVVIRAG